MILARAALAPLDVVLEVGVAGADLGDPRERRVRERRAAEVRVDEDSGRVQDPAQRRPPRGGELLQDRLDERPGLASGPEVLARALEHGPSRRERELVRLGCKPLVGEEPVDGGQVAERAGSGHTSSVARGDATPQARAGARAGAP